MVQGTFDARSSYLADYGVQVTVFASPIGSRSCGICRFWATASAKWRCGGVTGGRAGCNSVVSDAEHQIQPPRQAKASPVNRVSIVEATKFRLTGRWLSDLKDQIPCRSRSCRCRFFLRFPVMANLPERENAGKTGILLNGAGAHLVIITRWATALRPRGWSSRGPHLEGAHLVLCTR